MRKTELAELFHETEELLGSLSAENSRWGHKGIYAWVSPESGDVHVYCVKGPFVLAEIEDDQSGSADILSGFGTDEEFNDVLRELGPAASLPETGPPWFLPADQYGFDYFRELHRLLREHFEGQGFDGWWMGREVVLWDYDKISDAYEIEPVNLEE